MKLLQIVGIGAAIVLGALPAQAQNWYTMPSAWYVGAAGGGGNLDINCDAGNCDRTGSTWKIYGGLRFPNHTGAELMVIDLGEAHGDALHHVNLAPGKVEGRYWALAGVWSPELGNGFLANVKLGIAGSNSKTSGMDAGVASGADRDKFPHVYAGLGLGWKIDTHFEITADYDYSRISYRNIENGSDFHLKQTVDAGAWLLGVNYAF